MAFLMIVVWHDRDLRLEDHPALTYASKTGMPILPLFIHDEDRVETGGAAKWWLHHSLEDLKKRYQERGLDLVIRKGKTEEVFRSLFRSSSIDEVCWIERFAPKTRMRDIGIEKWLVNKGARTSVFGGHLLFHPTQIQNQSGSPYVVFSPFYKAALKEKTLNEPPLPVPKLPKGKLPKSDSLASLQLLPKIHWEKGIKATWQPGRKGAVKRLKSFCDQHLSSYGKERDFLDHEGTSRLSPHLAFGEISPREIWHACQGKKNASPFLRQLMWREFAYCFLYHFPHTPELSWQKNFEQFPWSKSEKNLRAWQKGKTGYPIVDAAMRQLWETGWMHNRARLIVGSFLVKDLRIHWVEGASWFWDTLVDADLANNSFGWQWVAGSGADAAPYFRIFNPYLQGKKFDPDGEYVRKYCPELKLLSTKWIHNPHEAPDEVLAKAKIKLGKSYPLPIVEHSEARELALAGYEKVKKKSPI